MKALQHIVLKKCLDGYFYNVNLTTGIGTCDSNHFILPGLYFTANHQCISGVCSNSTCIGKKENEDCIAHRDCNPGLYCNVNRCEAFIY